MAKKKAKPDEPPLRLEYLDPADLAANPLNYRTHPAAQTQALKDVIGEVGWAGALLYNERTNRLIDGHARKDLFGGAGKVPVLIGSWSEEQEAKILATLDPIAAMAEADKGKLDALLRQVQTESESVASMLQDLAKDSGLAYGNPEPGSGGDEFDTTPEAGPTRTSPGELWIIGGKHRLLVADCTIPENVARLMGGERVDTVVSDPPYGIDFDTDYRRFTSGFNVPRTNHKPVANDDKPFDPTPLLGFAHVILWGANCYCSKLPIGTWLVWDKRFKNGTAMLSDAELAWMKGGHGAYIFAETSQGFVRPEPIDHPTQKPVSVLQWCIEKCKAGDIVYDPFLGSGTTLIAAHRLNRRCYGLEIEPRYADVVLRRCEAEGLTVERT